MPSTPHSYQIPTSKTQQFKGAGTDIAGTAWQLTIHLARIGTAIFGTIEWAGTEAGSSQPTLTGIEHIHGEIDDERGWFDMTGFLLEKAVGLKLGIYSGNCNQDRMIGYWEDKELGGAFTVTRQP